MNEHSSSGASLGALRGFFETFLLVLLPIFYAMFVILIALYLKALLELPGLITVFAAIVLPMVVWVRIMQKRETESAEAQLKGFKISPEIQERTLEEYEQLMKKKDEK
jgi:hypothetical protein